MFKKFIVLLLLSHYYILNMDLIYEQEYINERDYSLEGMLNLLTDNVKKIENDDYIFYNVYKRLNEERKLRLEQEIKSKFLNEYKAIDFHYPEIIITENLDLPYYVGLDEYDKNIEFFTIRIEK